MLRSLFVGLIVVLAAGVVRAQDPDSVPSFGGRIQLAVVAVPDSQERHHARFRLRIALPDSMGRGGRRCVVWDSTAAPGDGFRIRARGPVRCSEGGAAARVASSLWLSLVTPATVRLVLGRDSTTLQVRDPGGISAGVLRVQSRPRLAHVLLPRHDVGAIRWGTAFVQCVPGKYDSTLCEGFAAAIPHIAATGYMRPAQYWSVRAIPPYHDPTAPIDLGAFGREAYSMDAWLPAKQELLRERSARFTALFPGVRVLITLWSGQRTVCDSGVCRPDHEAGSPARDVDRSWLLPGESEPDEGPRRPPSGVDSRLVSAPDPTYRDIRGCGVIHIGLWNPDTMYTRVENDSRCGSIRLTLPAPITSTQRFSEEGEQYGEIRITFQVAVSNQGDPQPLPLRLFIDTDSVSSFAWDTAHTGRLRGRVGFAEWGSGDHGSYELSESFDTQRHLMWRLIRTPGDTVHGGVLKRHDTTVVRTVGFTIRSVRTDSIRIPFRVQGIMPGAELPLRVALLDRVVHLSGHRVVRNPRILTLPFYEGVAVLRWREGASPLARRLALGRLGGSVVAVLPGNSPERDYIVTLGPAWRDSIMQSSGVRRLGGQIARFGLLTASDTPFVAARMPGALRDTTLIDAHGSCDGSDAAQYREVRRRLAIVKLDNPTPLERERVAGVANGQWHSAGDRFGDRLEITGTFDAVQAKLDMLYRLPEVLSAGLNWHLCPSGKRYPGSGSPLDLGL